jgi:hypothetical protein
MFRSSTKGGKNEKTHRILARIEDDDLRISRQEFQPFPGCHEDGGFFARRGEKKAQPPGSAEVRSQKRIPVNRLGAML